MRGRKPATIDDLKALPDHVVGEILGGELVVSPRPASPHAHSAAQIGFDLGPPFGRSGSGGPGGWVNLVEPELHLGADVLVPDLAGWRRERMPRVPDVPAFELAPDWVCEVASPSTGRTDRALKMPLYARAGVAHAWIVDPLQKTLEVFRLEGGRWVVLAAHGGDGKVRAEPFEWLEIELLRWWLEPDPPRP